MQIYKRSLVTMIWGFLIAPIAGVLGVVIGGFIFDDFKSRISIAIAVGVLVILYTIFGQSIRFTISEQGQLSYYRCGRMKHQFDIKNCQVGYHRKTTNLVYHEIKLEILPAGGELVKINASPLGKTRFEKMFVQLESLAANKA